MIQANDAESRATFEAWRKSLCAFTTFTVDAEGFYEDDDQQVAWSGWQARDAEVAAKDERIAELEEESKEWNQRYMAQALLAQRLLKAGGCAELIEELRAKLIATQAELEEQCGANTDFIRQYQDQVAGLNLRLAAREAQLTVLAALMPQFEPKYGAAGSRDIDIAARISAWNAAVINLQPFHAIAANTARVKVEALHNFAEDYGGGKYGLMNCFDALKQYADQIAKEAQS